MKTVLTSIYAGLFYIVWLPCAIIKDLVQILYIPFHTQRFVNAFVAFNHNAQNIVDYIEPSKPMEPPQPEPQRTQIGFRTFAQPCISSPPNPTNPHSPVCMH